MNNVMAQLADRRSEPSFATATRSSSGATFAAGASDTTRQSALVQARATLFRRRGVTALQIFGAAVVGLVVMVMLASIGADDAVMALGFAVCGSLAIAGSVQGVRALLTGGVGPIPQGFFLLIAAVPVVGGLFLTGLYMTLVGTILTLAATAEFSRGRQLRRRGKVLLPLVVPGADWSPSIHRSLPVQPQSSAVADQWRENGRTEHASVAAFARLTLDLMALGAPPSLIRAAQEDALDEIAHAEMCFSLASAFDGEHRSPGPFPEARYRPPTLGNRGLALAHLAVGSLVDGALHEGLSAAVVAKVAKRCTLPEVRSTLSKIASDEGRHAAHGWDVVEWCLREGGVTVAQALRGAALALPEKMHTQRPEPAEKGDWERFGIHSSALESEEFSKARARVMNRVEALVHTRASDSAEVAG